MKVHCALIVLGVSWGSHASVTVTVQADSGRIPVSPYLYGKNSAGISDDPGKPSSEAPGSVVYLSREAGLRMTRENGGNNLTKHNWRKKLTSHPDWYNNVYPHDWDFAAKEITTKLPGVQGFFGFQLLGWVASNTNNNFNDWEWGQSHPHVSGQNLAGGGVPNPSGNSFPAQVEGDPRKYLEPWPADSTAAILGHWFGPGGIGLDSSKLRYWNMDNEIEIWEGTHDDVDPALFGHVLTAEEAVQRWIAVAKAARKLHPTIKLAGPATPAEWQWYNWPGGGISYKGASYCWAEYLIKRLAEAQDSTGVRMIDVYDVHLYLIANSKEQVQNQYRLLWDTAYLDPSANGVHAVRGGWDANEKHQMFFHRVEGWLDKYFGKGHGIKVGSSESAVNDLCRNNPSEVAVWYASILGTFADHGAEFFTPWNWDAGMWETMHLFSRYGQVDRVKSTSSYDTLVSAYSSISRRNDSMTVILVNRGPSPQTADIVLSGFAPANTATSLRLSGLSGETFVSHTQNALQKGTVSVSGGKFSAELPGYSITAYLLTKAATGVVPRPSEVVRIRQSGGGVELSGGPSGGPVEIRASSGAAVAKSSWTDGAARFDLSGLPLGVYFVDWVGGQRKVTLSAK